jgi:hypothetical protein
LKETIQIGSAAGARVAALFFLIISGAIGYVVSALLSRPQTRRAEFVTLGGASTRTSAIIGTIVGATIYLVVCWSMLTGFNRIEVDGEVLRLHYFLAAEPAEIRRDELVRFEKKYAYRLAWRLGITTSKGETFESAVANESNIDRARVRLAQLAAE